jgi:hypothetical protein
MADPQAALLTQLRNIQARSGRTIAQLHAAVAGSGLLKHGERQSWLMEQFGLGYGDANTVAHLIDKPVPDLDGAAAVPSEAAGAEALDAIYAGAKAGLRPLHDALMKSLQGFGTFEVAPKKAYVSLRRKKQFAMVGPATRDCIEIGINAKALPPHARLKAMPPGGMCPYTTRIAAEKDIDEVLLGWLKTAHDAAA